MLYYFYPCFPKRNGSFFFIQQMLFHNTTHRPTAVTAAVAHAAIAQIEVQVPSVARVRSFERRTPNVAVVAYIDN